MPVRPALVLAALLCAGCDEFDRARIRAHLGGADSQLVVGYAYDIGSRVPEDDAEAVRWYRKAAQQGHPKAPFLLAEKYARGEGVEKDLMQAYMWFTVAAEYGKGPSATEVAKLEPLLTAEQIAEAKRRARLWVAKH